MVQSASTTTTTPTAHQDWTIDQVKQATGIQMITMADTKALNSLSPSQKRHLLSTIHQQQKQSDSAIKAILAQAKAQAKQAKAQDKQVQLSTKEKTALAKLPLSQAAKAQTKIAKVLAKQTKAKKVIVKKEIKKEKKPCAAWKASKKENPTHPKNPVSGRAVHATKRTFKIVDAVCKKNGCSKPGKSPVTGRPLKDTAREAKIVRELCASKTKAKVQKK